MAGAGDGSEGGRSVSGSTRIGEEGGLCIAERVDEGEGEGEGEGGGGRDGGGGREWWAGR